MNAALKAETDPHDSWPIPSDWKPYCGNLHIGCGLPMRRPERQTMQFQATEVFVREGRLWARGFLRG